MRLIDADALVEEIVNIDDLRRLSTASIGRALKAVPTIDAIPVEWLRGKIKLASNAGDLDSLELLEWLEMTWQKEQEART